MGLGFRVLASGLRIFGWWFRGFGGVRGLGLRVEGLRVLRLGGAWGLQGFWALEVRFSGLGFRMFRV